MKIKKYTLHAIAAMLIGMGSFGNASADSLKDKLDNIKISGFVDTSVSGNNLANTNGTQNRGFGLDQVELDVEYHADRVGLRFDLNVFPSSTATVTNDSLIEQGYVTYTVPGLGDDGLTLTFGKFNAPIGWELLDPNDMYQFSHALVFNYALPTNLTGLMASGQYGAVDFSAYWTNGTDVNGQQPAGMKTFGGRLGISPFKGLNVGFSYLQDKNNNNTSTTAAHNKPAATITDIDLTYDGIEGLVIGAEYNENKGFQGVVGGAGIRSRGYLITAHYDFNDMFGATVRYDYLDFDRSKTGTSTAYTGAITASLGDGLGALFEYRRDRNTAATADANGTPANSNVNSWALEATYGF